jgi:hypothetical protein
MSQQESMFEIVHVYVTKNWCYYKHKVTNVRNELQVLIEEDTKASNSLLYSMYERACVACAGTTQSQR